MKIGIFDTGTGGELVAKRLKELLPQHSYIMAIDREHAPYGNRSPEEIIALTNAAIQPLLSCDIIILACNTATTNALKQLQQLYPDVRFIGFEPMIKSAAASTRSHRITLLATNATKQSQRLRTLISDYASDSAMRRMMCCRKWRAGRLGKADVMAGVSWSEKEKGSRA